MSKSTKTSKFVMDENLIYSLISRQAGSVHKALSELVSNSYDSRATKVEVTINTHGFSVSDDGIGFRSEQEINDWFATIGFDHDASELHQDSSRYGTFGMGRLQSFAHGSTRWTTNQFIMDVDIKHKGLDFEIITSEPPLKGCHIEGTWYEPKSLTEIKEVVAELTHMINYFPITVTINGASINKAMKWDIQTNEVSLKRKEHGGLEIYNQGVYVETIPAYKYGSGIAVSTVPMKLNMARNEVITAHCEIFKSIKLFLKEDATKRATSTVKLDDDARAMLLNNYLNGEFGANTRDEIAKKKLIKSVNNQYHSIKSVLSKRVTIRPKNASKVVAERINQQSDLLVIEPIVLEWVNVETGAELIEQLHKQTYSWPLTNHPIEFDELASGVSTDHVRLDAKELSKTEQVMLKTMQYGLSEFQQYVHHYLVRNGYTEAEYRFRTLAIGESDTAEAWTDSVSYICIHRDIVKKCAKNGWRSIFRLGSLILHELLHTSSNVSENLHDKAFYETYHDFILDEGAHRELFTYIRKATAGYILQCRKTGITLSKYDLRDLQKEVDIAEILNNPNAEYKLGED